MFLFGMLEDVQGGELAIVEVRPVTKVVEHLGRQPDKALSLRFCHIPLAVLKLQPTPAKWKQYVDAHPCI